MFGIITDEVIISDFCEELDSSNINYEYGFGMNGYIDDKFEPVMTAVINLVRKYGKV